MFLARIVMAALLTLPLTQQPQPAPPPTTFRSGVDLLHVQVAVLDAEGRPVTDLRAADFNVTLDGRPRAVRLARFYGADTVAGRDALAAGTPAPAPLPQASVSNASDRAGRIVVFVVDRDSLRAGSGKAVLQTASRLLDRLTTADASGFVALPSGRLVIGRDHGQVRGGIQNAVGTQRTPPHWRYHVELREALAFERRDGIGIQHVIERECLNSTADCGERVAEQAREMLFTIRAETCATLQGLRQVIDGLREIRAPKVIVLLSGGLWFELDTLTEFNLMARRAAAARTVIHALHVDQVAFDVEDRGRGPSAWAASERVDGLRQVAASTGGTFYQAVGTAAGVFNRIATEVTSFYEVGIEVRPEDAATTARTLQIKVTRPGATVRTRRDILLDPATEKPEREAQLHELLRQPVNLAELPISLTTYVTRGEEPTTLKVILAAEIGGREPPSEAIDWAFVVFREEQQLAYGRDRATRAASVVTAAQLPPGQYRARFVAIGADGREGVVETALPVGLRPYGELHSSDVMLGENVAGRFLPGTSFDPGREMQALVELYAASPERFEAVSVAWELYRVPEMQLVRSARSNPQATDAPGRRVCEVALPGPETSGAYVLSAVVHQRGRPLGKVSRALQVR